MRLCVKNVLASQPFLAKARRETEGAKQNSRLQGSNASCSFSRMRVSLPRLFRPLLTVRGSIMKYCPACNFSFPDAHKVCDFDGTELVPDPKRPSAVSAASRPSLFRRISKSRMLFASVTILSLFVGAVLIGYYQSIGEVPAVVQDPPSAGAALIKTATASRRRDSRGPNTVRRRSRSVARLRHSTIPSNRQEPQVAERRDVRTKSDEKEPRLTAFLKTTWNVLKKPFKF